MLESVLGDVSWERIDDKRASRIAQYCPGDIGDDATALASLRDWAAAKMITFYEALEPLGYASHQRGNELIGGSCAHATRFPCELLSDTFVLE